MRDRILRALRDYQSIAHHGHASGAGWSPVTPNKCRACRELARLIEEVVA